MDKDRISAARKKLKEFQKKKYQSSQNVGGPTESHDGSQSPSSDNLQETHPDALQYIQHNFQSSGSNESIGGEARSANDSPHVYSNIDYVQNFVPPPLLENPSVQNLFQEPAPVNGSVETPKYNNFTPSHSRNESTSTVSSQIIHDNIDNKEQFLNSFPQQIENSNTGFNMPNSTSGSLQKEHLLQMANAVANVLVDEQGLDEKALNHCDLEQRNQFLTSCLEEQKKLVNQLHIQVSQSNSRVSELEAIINAKNTEFESKLIREINPLKEQIQLNAQTIGILVGEKEELIATNSQCQETIKQKNDEMSNLNGKLKSSEHRIVELENELASVKTSLDDFSKSYQQLQNNYKEAFEKLAKLQKENEDSELEISEIRQQLAYKNTELAGLHQELQEKLALLSLSELRVQQLTNSPHEMHSLETQHQATKVLEQQLCQMKDALESVSGEKDEVSKKYQSYVQQLDERYNKALEELENAKKVVNSAEIREKSYIERLSELEKQLQREKDKVIDVNPVEYQSEKIDILTKSMDNLVLEQENLQSLLNEKDNEIELLKKELQELQDARMQSLEASKLAQALQSEQLGASRAVSQNQQLKVRLDEMENAFTSLIDTKLDLTEKLQAERSIGKKMNAQLNDMEQQIEQLKQELLQKEAVLIELEKEKLQAAQIEDQIQHYQAQSHNATTLQQELQKALTMIESLKKENQILRSKSNVTENSNASSQESPETNETLPEGAVENSTLNVEEEAQESIDNLVSHEVSTRTESVISENSTIPSISEPMKKLEARFKETMERVAELTDEKQRLEHLVLQLQGETETIGEYVTLYQRQRAILKEKSREKENTFKIILEQRNQQQEQLHKLKVLVAELLKSKNSNSTVPVATVAEENMPISDNPEGVSNNIEVVDGNVHKANEEVVQQPDNTTSKILDLLTEIKDCNTCILEPNFHPCPWCSGKLITV